MSRITKWRHEKTKVKVVFRLQFHATHVPQSGWDKLFISFIPGDSGKSIAKTTKANVRNGTCKWADPIYETTRLLQDSKSKQYDEKLYNLVVSMGSLRTNILGEATINLSDYVDALKPSTIALPLQGCSFGTLLHITVQLLTSKTGFREFELQRDQREKGLQSGIDSYGHIGIGKVHNSEEEDVSLNEEYAGSAAGCDGSSNTSESLYAYKHDSSSMHDVDSLRSTMSVDLLSHCQISQLEKGDSSANHNTAQVSRDSALRWVSDHSIDNELSTAYEENIRLRERLELAESSFLNLKLEVGSLQSVAIELGTETEKIFQLVTSEASSVKELAKDVSLMKAECMEFKDALTSLKDLRYIPQLTITEKINSPVGNSLQDAQLQFLKVISSAEGKIRELQSHACLLGHECSGSNVYSELDALRNILLNLKCENCESKRLMDAVPSEFVVVKDVQEICTDNNRQYVSGDGFGLDLCQPDCILQHFSVPPPVSDPVGAIDALKGQVFDLVRELDEAKIEKESLNRKMDEMECYYENLIQELEESQKRMVEELHHLRNEHSTCLVTISSSSAELESLRLNTNQQILQLADEKCDLDVLNKELERRVVSSEAALRRARLNYSVAVEKLQKDLELLSSQVVSMFETNENLIKQAFIEPSQSYLQRDQKVLQIGDEYAVATLPQYQNQCLGTRRKSLGGDMHLEHLKRSFSFQEELYQKVEAELIEIYNINLDLDIYSKALKESLLEANTNIKMLKGKMDEFVEELEVSIFSQNRLMERLHKANDDIHALNECKSSFISQCSDLTMHNQLLEDKLKMVSQENHQFSEKLKELESIKAKCEHYEARLETCLIDNANQSLSLKQEAVEKEELQKESLLLKEKLSILKTKSAELTSLNENLEEYISFVRDKLVNLLDSYGKQFLVVANSHPLKLEQHDIKNIILQLEEIQHNACEKISQLIGQNEILEYERMKVERLSEENHQFSEKLKDLESIKAKCEHYEAKLETCLLDNANQSLSLRQEALEKDKLQKESSLLKEKLSILKTESGELASLNENLEEYISFIRDKLVNILDSYGKQFPVLANSHPLKLGLPDIKNVILQLEEIQHNACEKSSALIEQNEILEGERVTTLVSLNTASSEILAMKQRFKSCMQEIVTKLDMSNLHVDKLQADLESVANKFHFSSEIAEKYVLHSEVISADLCLLEDQMQELASKNGLLAKDISCMNALAEELWSSKSTIVALTLENQELVLSLLDETGQSIRFSSENTCLKEILTNFSVRLQNEKSFRDELEGNILDLTFQLNNERDKVIDLNQKNAELLHVKDLALNLELENSRLAHLLGQQKVLEEELQRIYDQDSSECQLLELYDFSLAAEVTLVYILNQYEILRKDHLHLMSLERSLSKYKERYYELENMFNQQFSSEAHLNEGKTSLVSSNESLESEFEGSSGQSRLLSDSNNSTQNLGKCKNKLTMMETGVSLEKIDLPASKEEKLKNTVENTENELSCLTDMNEELEILIVVLKSKLYEQCADMAFLEEYKNSSAFFRSRCDEISHKLNEQLLRTEEFKNLSIHFKELKDKAETECLLAREKREAEGLPVAVNDSLRMAFMKEQHATQLLELKQQISISKKHGEEMLLKLQDAIDEVETRKKSEAVNSKRNEELLQKLNAVDTELQSVLAERRDLSKAYDRVKAELECALLSLECCKEEYDKLEASLQESETEKSQLVIELNLKRIQLENNTKLKKHVNSQRTRAISILDSEDADLTEAVKLHTIKCESLHQIPEAVVSELVPEITRTSLDANSESPGSCLLKSSMEHLHEELEKMKNENTGFHIDHDVDPDHQVPRNEIFQLQKANEELRRMFPLVDEISSSGNALERVLALEVELAEALKEKDKSNLMFQSSFLKQHNNDEAVFKSFRDINELVKETLELKGRHATVEAELREMHDRYSQLSLQFAEVEGERQRLTITLKNVRASKKSVPLNRS